LFLCAQEDASLHQWPNLASWLLQTCAEVLIKHGHRIAGSSAGCFIGAGAVSPLLWRFLMHLTKMHHGSHSVMSMKYFIDNSDLMAEGDISQCTLPDELALAGLPTNSSFNTIHAFVDALKQQVSTYSSAPLWRAANGLLSVSMLLLCHARYSIRTGSCQVRRE